MIIGFDQMFCQRVLHALVKLAVFLKYQQYRTVSENCGFSEYAQTKYLHTLLGVVLTSIFILFFQFPQISNS
jgi:hypothetical protein